jgi:hypothetical protein
MIGQMAQIISYSPSPLLLFDRLLFPAHEIAAPASFERAMTAAALVNGFFSLSPGMLAIAA